MNYSPTFSNGSANFASTAVIESQYLDKIRYIIPFALGASLVCTMTSDKSKIVVNAVGSTYSGTGIACHFLFVLKD